jgi:hypothetical protein
METNQDPVAPDYIKNSVDLKESNIIAFAATINAAKDNSESTNFKKNRLILITNFGHITCDIVIDDDTYAATFFAQATKTRNLYLTEQPNIPLVTNNSTLLLVENADVVSFSNLSAKTHFDSLALFTDQIVGYTFGIASPNE